MTPDTCHQESAPRNSTGYAAGEASTYRLEDLADALTLRVDRKASWREVATLLGIDHTTIYHIARRAAQGLLPPPRNPAAVSWTAQEALEQVQLCLRELRHRGELSPKASGDETE